MGFLNVVLGDNIKEITIKNNQLNIELWSSQIRQINVSDISLILLENRRVSISAYTISFLSENKVTVLFCDAGHLPNAILLPFNSHFSQLKILKLQIEIPKPLQKQLWALIIKQKIHNQMLCLKFLKINSFQKLIEFEKQVTSGDTKNVEATAAQHYFKALMGASFTRQQNNVFNSAVNYGYSIVRSLISRAIVVSGLQPCFGIHHCNELNNFNLADDFIEPFRPFVDLFVMTNIDLRKDEFLPADKRKILELMSIVVVVDNQKCSLTNAVEKVINSFVSALKNKQQALSLPLLNEIENYVFE